LDVEAATEPLLSLEADLHVLGICEGDEPPAAGVAGREDVRAAFKQLTLLRPDPRRRLLVVGLGRREELDAERLRVAAALAEREGRRYEARAIAWQVPASESLGAPAAAAALVEGTILASHRFDRFRSRERADKPPPRLERLTLAGAEGGDAAEAIRAARAASQAANRARELQALPANVATPSFLAERAREVAGGHEALSAQVLGRDEIAERGMGGILAVSAGSAQEPRLIALRYAGGGTETIGFVGKAVTFDTGGISIKPASKMHEMKMDMSGGAAVIEALGAIAELGLPLDIVGVVPAVENMPSGAATRPGDIITHLSGKTVEITNTDAEGRLILADAITWSVRELGAKRLVDLATLTGGVTVALGSTYAALVANDDAWAERVLAAAERTGELAWRMPLHPEYAELMRGTDADLVNSSPQRKASPLTAAAFLAEFVEGVPWAHLDIAGTAWDTGREYVGKGPNGMGTRLLVELARDLAR